MNRSILFFILILIAFSTIAQNNPVIVELFTSQGCSSCPAADKNLTEILKQAVIEGKSVIGLSFHVDYWNYIGWKDPYSSKEFTQRQRSYAQQLNLNSVYTPQMIVNGKNEFVGSDKRKAESSLKEALHQLPSYQIKIAIFSITNSVLTAHYSVDKKANEEILNVAVVEHSLENYVSRGENEGKKLHHNNVVRSFKSFSLKREDNIQISIAGIDTKNASIVFYIQNKDWSVAGATEKSLK